MEPLAGWFACQPFLGLFLTTDIVDMYTENQITTKTVCSLLCEQPEPE